VAVNSGQDTSDTVSLIEGDKPLVVGCHFNIKFTVFDSIIYCNQMLLKVLLS